LGEIRLTTAALPGILPSRGKINLPCQMYKQEIKAIADCAENYPPGFALHYIRGYIHVIDACKAIKENSELIKYG